VRTLWTLAAMALLAACTANSGANSTTDTAAGATAPAANDDPDQRQPGGVGIPAGYVAKTDRTDANIADASYTTSGSDWEVRTGPAHVLYAAKDTASGVYGATATFEQLEAPRHPEAFGIFIGGSNLDQPTQRYTYFLVRGGGEFLVKVRDGNQTRDVLTWRASPDVPKADSSGRATYKLTAHVAADTVHFMVNDKLVGAAPKAGLPTDGIAGLRVNHNLHVKTRGVTVTKG
jgi:hypothetical protein